MDQGSRLATIVYPPEIVKQTVNSKKNKSQGQSGPRGKMGQKMTKWTKHQDQLLLFTT